MDRSWKARSVQISPTEQAEQARIAAELAEVGFVLPGSLAERRLSCTHTGCHCHGSPPQLHGPYWYLTRKVSGKTVTRMLSAEQAEKSPGAHRQRPATCAPSRTTSRRSGSRSSSPILAARGDAEGHLPVDDAWAGAAYPAVRPSIGRRSSRSSSNVKTGPHPEFREVRRCPDVRSAWKPVADSNSPRTRQA